MSVSPDVEGALLRAEIGAVRDAIRTVMDAAPIGTYASGEPEWRDDGSLVITFRPAPSDPRENP